MHLRHAALAAALLMSPALAACGGEDEATAGTTAAPAAAGPSAGATSDAATAVPVMVTAEEGKALLDAGGMRIIDVRTPEEFAAGSIQGAELLDLTSGQFAAEVESLPRDVTYFVYCRSDNRSGTATAQMAALGFASVYELEGGIIAWEAAGMPVVN
jgi:phage shock protein E